MDIAENDKVFCVCEFINTGKPEYIPVIKDIIDTIQNKYEIYLTGDYSNVAGTGNLWNNTLFGDKYYFEDNYFNKIKNLTR